MPSKGMGDEVLVQTEGKRENFLETVDIKEHK